MTQLITGYFTGMVVMALIAWWIHNKYYRAHQKEYRRLMSGIEKAIVELGAWATRKNNKDMADPPSIRYDLKQLWLGDK